MLVCAGSADPRPAPHEAPGWHARHAHCCMTLARTRAATRNALVTLGASLSLLLPLPARADGSPQLLLPLVAALAAASAAQGLPEARAAADPRHREMLRFLPKQLQIPDGYRDAEQDFVDVRRSFDPVDADRIVWLDLLGRPRRGWMASLAYDEEVRGPLAETDEVFRIYFERRF